MGTKLHNKVPWLIAYMMDKHTFCITVLEPLTFNLDYRFLRQNVTFPVLVSYAHSLPVVFFGIK